MNAFTIGKLVPLGIFIGIGVFFVDWGRLTPLTPITTTQAATGVLLLIFAFGGFDVISVPAGEAKDPRRHVPFAFIATMLSVTLIMTLAQIVTMTTVTDVTRSATPMADAAMGFLGPLGAAMISIGSVISMIGNNAGHVLSGSRMLFALAENDALPQFFRRIHPVYRTPANAIWFTSLVALLLGLSGSFAAMAAASAVARLMTYIGVSAATLALRWPRFSGRTRPATFVIPFGATIPVLAILVSMAILAGASQQQWLGGAAALAAGAVLFATNNVYGRRS